LGAVLIGVRYTAAYGAIGSFIALLLWCYWGVSIIFFGAEYAQVLSDYRRQRKDETQNGSQRSATACDVH
jgi:membrane protein